MSSSVLSLSSNLTFVCKGNNSSGKQARLEKVVARLENKKYIKMGTAEKKKKTKKKKLNFMSRMVRQYAMSKNKSTVELCYTKVD